jgi:serine/threonine protein kinase
LPASYAIQPGLTHVGAFEWSGGFAEVAKGDHQGRPVAIKQLKVGTKDEFDKIFKVVTALGRVHYNHLISAQRLCREVILWKRLSHQNILPLLGVSVSKDPRHFRIISEWMPNGNVMEYTSSNPEANRLRLVSSVVRSP